MKRFVKTHNQLEFDITIILYPELHEIAASVISSDPEEVDDQALADYHAFILESELILEDNELMLLEKSSSKSSPTSKYYTICDLEQNIVGSMKSVIFLRISNHGATDDADIKKWIRQQREKTAANYNVKWKVREVIVNNQTFKDYDDALDYMRECAKNYSQILKK